jgi:hypothetical protein
MRIGTTSLVLGMVAKFIPETKILTPRKGLQDIGGLCCFQDRMPCCDSAEAVGAV